ncbi:MAG TPA: helix-turn-helix domain-containing protein, partial [Bryobacteraceae bacterium]|nr:helix-turn-helix domain-containing protein [Bryobacteraceae bacterium]
TKGTTLTVPLDEFMPHTVRKTSRHGETLDDFLRETERTEIFRALEDSRWVVFGPNGAATRLGMKRSTLVSRMQKLGIRLLRAPGPDIQRSISAPHTGDGRILEWPVNNSPHIDEEREVWRSTSA